MKDFSLLLTCPASPRLQGRFTSFHLHDLSFISWKLLHLILQLSCSIAYSCTFLLQSIPSKQKKNISTRLKRITFTRCRGSMPLFETYKSRSSKGFSICRDLWWLEDFIFLIPHHCLAKNVMSNRDYCGIHPEEEQGQQTKVACAQLIQILPKVK